ncbi:dhkI-1 [Symbiodinium sp. KB8]|nr:dhkI-1 [Symbiodinium sp. KB8]
MKAGARDVSHATAASHTTSGSSAAAKVLTSSSDVRFSASGNASIMLSGLSSRMSSGAGTPLAGAGSCGTPSMGSGTPGLSSASSAAGSTSDKGLPGSVLIVDDTAVTRQLLARVVKRTFPSTTVLVAEDGQQALRVFVEHHEAVRSGLKDARGAPLHRVSCVLMDKSMPVMDGFACANALRQQHGYSGRIVGVTGNALRQDIEDFKANGADAVLTKPVDRKLLQAAVRGALRMALEGPTPSMMQRVASGASSQ